MDRIIAELETAIFFNKNCINTKFKIELYTGYKGYLDYLYIKPTLLQYIEPTLL